MTVSSPLAATGADPPPPVKSARVPITPLRVIARLAAVIGLAIFAFWDTFAAIGVELAAHTLLTYLPAAAVLCIVAAIGVTLRHDDEPPIYDRDTDFIVGGVVLLISIAFVVLLNRRYLPGYLVTHVDILGLLLFLFGGCVLAFGLRPAMRYRWVWLLSLSLFPLPYRVAVIMLGGNRISAGAVMLILATAATAIAVGRTRRSALGGAAISAGLGAVLLAVVAIVEPEARFLVYQWIPAVTCTVTTGVIYYIGRRQGTGTLRPFPHRGLNPLTAPRFPRAMILLVAASVLLHVVGAPTVRADAGITVPGLRTAPPMIVPAGWQQVDATGLLPSVSYGWHAVRSRQLIEQREGQARFDYQSRPRRVAVDTIETALPLTLDIYLPAMHYDLNGSRVSRPLEVPLSGGATGELQTLVDDRNNLTYNRLVWRWNNGFRTQQVTLFSVDNHEKTASFPKFLRFRDTWRISNGMVTLLLRGNATTEDLDPVFKDRDLLVECANALIDTQLATIGGRDG